MRVDGVLETCLYVDDLDAAEVFYRDVLGLELIASEPGRHRFFRCGSSMLLLFYAPATSDIHETDVPRHGAHGPGHLALRVEEASLPAWREHLTARGVTIEQFKLWPGEIPSLYFRDPAGNSLELAPARLWADGG